MLSEVLESSARRDNVQPGVRIFSSTRDLDVVHDLEQTNVFRRLSLDANNCWESRLETALETCVERAEEGMRCRIIDGVHTPRHNPIWTGRRLDETHPEVVHPWIDPENDSHEDTLTDTST